MISEQAVVGADAVGPGFLGDVVGLPEGDAIFRCMQCGTCSASCPLGDVLEYGPRQIILKARARGHWRRLGEPVRLDVCRLLHVLLSLSAGDRSDRHDLAGGPRPRLAGRLSAAGGAADSLPEPLHVWQRPGPVAAQAAGLGQGPGRGRSAICPRTRSRSTSCGWSGVTLLTIPATGRSVVVSPGS